MSKNNSKTAGIKIKPGINYKTLDSFFEGCQVIGYDWRYLYLNDSAIIHARRTRQELEGHTMTEVYPSTESTSLFRKLNSCMKKRDPLLIENKFTYPDGSQGYFELRVEPVPEGIFILSIDITERKRAIQRIKYLNASLLALRNINQLITKEKNRERLIRKSCDMMVKNRGFLLAWILLTDEKNNFVSAAATGNREMRTTYLKKLKKGNCPPCFEKILKSEKTFCLCEDIIKKHDCLPGCFSGDGKGFISRLEYKGKVYGVISVYIPSGIAYDSEEMNLLAELVGDVSYALHSIEIEQKHKKSEQDLHNSEKLYRSLFENMLNGFAYCKMLYRQDGIFY